METISDEPVAIENTCGDCIYYNGERCTGKFEGHERCAGSAACDEYDCGSDYDMGNQPDRRATNVKKCKDILHFNVNE